MGIQGGGRRIVIIEEEAQALALIEENCEDRRWLSTIGEETEVDSVEGNSVWILQNIQKFNRMMGVTMERMEEQVCMFFTEIYKRLMVKRKRIKKEGKGRKKSGDGTPRELKRLECSVNYEGRRKGKGREEEG